MKEKCKNERVPFAYHFATQQTRKVSSTVEEVAVVVTVTVPVTVTVMVAMADGGGGGGGW